MLWKLNEMWLVKVNLQPIEYYQVPMLAVVETADFVFIVVVLALGELKGKVVKVRFSFFPPLILPPSLPPSFLLSLATSFPGLLIYS